MHNRRHIQTVAAPPVALQQVVDESPSPPSFHVSNAVRQHLESQALSELCNGLPLDCVSVLLRSNLYFIGPRDLSDPTLLRSFFPLPPTGVDGSKLWASKGDLDLLQAEEHHIPIPTPANAASAMSISSQLHMTLTCFDLCPAGSVAAPLLGPAIAVVSFARTPRRNELHATLTDIAATGASAAVIVVRGAEINVQDLRTLYRDATVCSSLLGARAKQAWVGAAGSAAADSARTSPPQTCTRLRLPVLRVYGLLVARGQYRSFVTVDERRLRPAAAAADLAAAAAEHVAARPLLRGIGGPRDERLIRTVFSDVFRMRAAALQIPFGGAPPAFRPTFERAGGALRGEVPPLVAFERILPRVVHSFGSALADATGALQVPSVCMDVGGVAAPGWVARFMLETGIVARVRQTAAWNVAWAVRCVAFLSSCLHVLGEVAGARLLEAGIAGARVRREDIDRTDPVGLLRVGFVPDRSAGVLFRDLSREAFGPDAVPEETAVGRVLRPLGLVGPLEQLPEPAGAVYRAPSLYTSTALPQLSQLCDLFSGPTIVYAVGALPDVVTSVVTTYLSALALREHAHDDEDAAVYDKITLIPNVWRHCVYLAAGDVRVLVRYCPARPSERGMRSRASSTRSARGAPPPRGDALAARKGAAGQMEGAIVVHSSVSGAARHACGPGCPRPAVSALRQSALRDAVDCRGCGPRAAARSRAPTVVSSPPPLPPAPPRRGIGCGLFDSDVDTDATSTADCAPSHEGSRGVSPSPALREDSPASSPLSSSANACARAALFGVLDAVHGAVIGALAAAAGGATTGLGFICPSSACRQVFVAGPCPPTTPLFESLVTSFAHASVACRAAAGRPEDSDGDDLVGGVPLAAAAAAAASLFPDEMAPLACVCRAPAPPLVAVCPACATEVPTSDLVDICKLPTVDDAVALVPPLVAAVRLLRSCGPPPGRVADLLARHEAAGGGGASAYVVPSWLIDAVVKAVMVGTAPPAGADPASCVDVPQCVRELVPKCAPRWAAERTSQLPADLAQRAAAAAAAERDADGPPAAVGGLSELSLQALSQASTALSQVQAGAADAWEGPEWRLRTMRWGAAPLGPPVDASGCVACGITAPPPQAHDADTGTLYDFGLLALAD